MAEPVEMSLTTTWTGTGIVFRMVGPDEGWYLLPQNGEGCEPTQGDGGRTVAEDVCQV